MDNKSIISPKLGEDFYTKDRGKISFWIARAEKYDIKRVYDSCIRAGASEEVAKGIARDVNRLA